MTSLKTILYKEFVAGRSLFDWCFMLTGICLQIMVYVLAKDEPLALLAGLTGVISVCLCAQGKISMYLFGVVNIITYIVIAYRQRLYGEVAINAFYFSMQMLGILTWSRHYASGEEEKSSHLRARTLNNKVFLTLVLLTLLASVGTEYGLKTWTNDSDPYFDAFTTVPAVLAEVLMVLGFRAHWWLWLFIDMGCIWMWLRAGNYSMAALYLFWCVNCIYGLINWIKSAEK